MKIKIIIKIKFYIYTNDLRLRVKSLMIKIVQFYERIIMIYI